MSLNKAVINANNTTNAVEDDYSLYEAALMAHYEQEPTPVVKTDNVTIEGLKAAATANEVKLVEDMTVPAVLRRKVAQREALRNAVKVQSEYSVLSLATPRFAALILHTEGGKVKLSNANAYTHTLYGLGQNGMAHRLGVQSMMLAYVVLSTRNEVTLDELTEDKGRKGHVWGNAYLERLRRLTLANREILEISRKEIDLRTHEQWASKMMELVIRAQGLMLVTVQDNVVVATDRGIDLLIRTKGYAALEEEITDQNRRVPYTKKRFPKIIKGKQAFDREPGQVKLARLMQEGTAYRVNVHMLETFEALIEEFAIVPSQLTTSMHHIIGSMEQRSCAALYSEWSKDSRGRDYMVAHHGPNAQASEIGKVLYEFTHGFVVEKGSPEHAVLLEEIEDTKVKGSIKEAALNPVKFLLDTLDRTGKEEDHKWSKGHFKFVSLAVHAYEIETKGSSEVYIPFGPDAKCSGAQILGIIACDEGLKKACGLHTEGKGVYLDPYQLALVELEKLLEGTEWASLPLPTRDEIKSPFMAVQYGGSIRAIINAKGFADVMLARGIKPELFGVYAAFVQDGILSALGELVAALVTEVEDAVTEHLERLDTPVLNYRLSDGFKGQVKGKATMILTYNPFTVSTGQRGATTFFGSIQHNTGWDVEVRGDGVLERKQLAAFALVHFIQSLDALVMRETARQAKDLGITQFVPIHDQFKTRIDQVPQLNEAIARAYIAIFNDRNPLQEFFDLLEYTPSIEFGAPNLDEDMLRDPRAYYFS